MTGLSWHPPQSHLRNGSVRLEPKRVLDQPPALIGRPMAVQSDVGLPWVHAMGFSLRVPGATPFKKGTMTYIQQQRITGTHV